MGRILAVVFAIGLIGGSVGCPGGAESTLDSLQNSGSSSGSGSGSGGSVGSSGCTSNANPQFTAHLVDLSTIEFIDPPGRPVGTDIKPHAYLYGQRPLATQGFPVYAPANGRVTSMSYYYQNEPMTGRNIDQYILFYEVSCEVTLVLDHLSVVARKLSAVSPPQTGSTSTSNLSNPVVFTAGELVGYVGGDFQGSPIQAFTQLDLRLYNTSITNGCESYAHWGPTSTSSPYTHCAFDYFQPSLRSQYLAKYGLDSVVMPQTSCGSPCRNVLGKIAGKWFLDSGAGGDYGPTLAIDLNLDGSTIKASSANWGFKGTGPDPQTSSGPACYESEPQSGPQRYLFFSNVTQTSADVATGSGTCPLNFPTTGFKTYYR